MKKVGFQFFAAVITIAVVFILPSPARAQSASETLYKSKCAGCHGPDGSGSAIGQKLGAHNFQTAEVQKMSDVELSAIITNGKNKMPSYGKTLKVADIKGLVEYIRSLAAAK